MFKGLRRKLRYIPYIAEFLRFQKMTKEAGRTLPVTWSNHKALLADKTVTVGFDRHYTYHTAWAARKILAENPEVHSDFASSTFLIGILSASLKINHYDYREPDLELPNVVSGSANLVNLPFPDNSLPSVSCLHVIEHIGLGRYGDPLDPEGDLKAINELKRCVAPGGLLLLAMPIGRRRVQFNAHRVYGFEDIVGLFREGWALESHALIPDTASTGHLIENASPDLMNAQRYGCGCFAFRKAR